MTEMNKLKFSSFMDFFRKAGALFKGPTFLSAFFNLDSVFRTKLIITVSLANNCGG